MTTGIPQGLPVSPIVFLLYSKPLFDELERHHPYTKSTSHVDDVGLIVVGKQEAANCKKL